MKRVAVEDRLFDETLDAELALRPWAKLSTVFSRTPSRAASRCNFAAIKQRENALAKTAVPEAATAIARAVKRALGDDEQLASLLDDDPQDIAALALNGADVGRIRSAFDGALETAYETGRVTGANELSRAGRPLTFAALREKAAGYIAANGFRMAENVSEATRAVIQGELLTGVKSGKRPAAVREAIWDALVRKGLTSRDAALGVETDEAVVGALNALWVDEEEDAAHYLDTLVRTNSFEAMNEARYAEFTDPEVRGFVQALEYSAILDSNTTPICEHLDGRVYRADNEEVWNKFRPPNHYNCRSVLIPVTAIDGWDGAESEEPEIDPQVGFFTRWDEGEHLRGKISDKDTSAGELFTHERFTRRAPLYVNRQLLNPEPFIEWAREAGFEQTLSPDDLHVTVAFSREPVDWEAPPDAERLVMVQGGTRTVESLGDEGAVVLRFESPELQARWQALRDAGASWDYEEYQPHITITYAKPEGLQLEKITPYAGDLEFGPERFEPLDTESVEKIVEDKL